MAPFTQVNGWYILVKATWAAKSEAVRPEALQLSCLLKGFICIVRSSAAFQVVKLVTCPFLRCTLHFNLPNNVLYILGPEKLLKLPMFLYICVIVFYIVFFKASVMPGLTIRGAR